MDNHDLPPKSADNDHSMVIEVDQLGSTDLPPLPAKPIDDGTIKKKNSMISSNGTLNGVPMPDDEERRLRLAKVQVEYDVYVKNSR